MENKRRQFLKLGSLACLGIAGGGSLKGLSPVENIFPSPPENLSAVNNFSAMENNNQNNASLSIIGQYGDWAAGLRKDKLPSLSFRKQEFANLDPWRKTAKKQVTDRMAVPFIGNKPAINMVKQYDYDGLHIEELNWQLPYGRATEAIVLKPVNAKGKLPAILAFHDHGGNKFFGTKKITKTSDQQLALMADHQKEYYEGFAWANEMARRGYVVLVADAFTFASRKVMLQDVPEKMRDGLTDPDLQNADGIAAYNKWAGEHEHIMAKSLFSAGTTWPGVFFAEDKIALDILCDREDVDASRIGCGGLSGGGLRTVFMGGLDPRIKCAVCVGFMTTWKDFVLHKSFTHTWMVYVPLLPNELDFPEILGLRAPLATLVLNDEQDDLYTLPEMKAADKILREVYAKAGAANHFNCSYYPGPHKFDAKMQAEAFAWFDKWLKK
ncbi:MAG: twin-arginine translocation signal protein [Ferruginibacter sp.]|uniref:dienelactone hydrolase family protein n=1 Tax=Ferruginibacter sp. TaxID=1940288 RepID=UPI002657E6BA|nr:alpha/beta hydrolase family protein [Ferruginibacter sp.]MDB5276517.1 twin-arginine translocation signal protein [Ferruginibacter sp.]